MSAEFLTLLLRILEHETVDDEEWAIIRLLAESCLISCRGDAVRLLSRAEPVLARLSSGYRAVPPPEKDSPAAS